MRLAERFLELFKAGRVSVDEFMIENLTRTSIFCVKNFLHDSFKQSHIAVDAYLQEKIGELGSTPEPGPNFLWIFETDQTGFRQWIDVHDFAAAPFRVQQRSQHARMIRPRILSDNKNRVSQIEVFERHGAFAKTDRFFHPGAAGFVAHVRSVGEVVGPKLSHKELIKKRGFIAGAA